MKFLLIDAAVALVGFSLLLAFQTVKHQHSLLGKTNNKDILDQAQIGLPALEELLDLEILARKEGSGIQFDSLIGLWRFVSVWKQGTDQEDSISSALLRLFSASLELSKDETSDELNRFNIINSIQFGSLLIRFTGSGKLKQPQPLLPFFFKCIELKLGNIVLFSRTLDTPEEKNMPFFALIAIEESGGWLSARGRGGGLALWMKDSSTL